MKSWVLALSLLILLSGCATFDEYNRPDPWTKDQILLQGVSTTLNIIDWGQTLDIADNHDKYYEINPIIGKHPSRGRVNTYFTLATLIKIGITHILPSKWRKWWLGANIMISGYLVNHNYQIGLRMGW